MKYCSKCGVQIADDSRFCPNCGFVTNPSEQVDTVSDTQKNEIASASVASIVLGIIGIVGAFLLAIVGHVCSIIAISIGINDCLKKRKPTGLILGIIGEVCSILSSVIGAAVVASLM